MKAKFVYLGFAATGLISAMGCSSGLPNVSSEGNDDADTGQASADDSGTPGAEPDAVTADSAPSATGAPMGTPNADSQAATPVSGQSPGDGAVGDGSLNTASGDATTRDSSVTADSGDAGTNESTGALDAANATTNDSATAPSEATTTADLGDSTTSSDSAYGGLGQSCITTLWGTYVQRTDGVLLWESLNNEQPILDSSTGRPLAGITSVEDGPYHGCAAISDGSAKCWQTNAGSGNYYGQLGNGTTTVNSVLYRATPVLTAAGVPLTNVSSIATNSFADNACAVTNDGKLYCWGYLTWLVNNGANLTSGYAQAITTDGLTPLTGVIQAALGPLDACALVKPQGASTNEVWCWGYNGAGELGQGSTVPSQYPVRVLGLTNPTKVAVSAYQNDATVCVLDGSNVLCWGVNAGDGVAGINSTVEPVQSPSPVVVQSGATLGGVIDLQPGGTEFAVLLSNGTIWTWGDGAAIYAANNGITNVLALGYGGGYGGATRYLTSDGVYHVGTTIVPVNCNAL